MKKSYVGYAYKNWGKTFRHSRKFRDIIIPSIVIFPKGFWFDKYNRIKVKITIKDIKNEK